MISKWSNKKNIAMSLRKKGHSIRDIERHLGIPRSTLSGWFRGLHLSPKAEARLKNARLQGLVRARRKAIEWHRSQKKRRQNEARHIAQVTFHTVRSRLSIEVMKALLAALYMGEGAKRDGDLALASSNPDIVRFYISALQNAYQIPRNSFKIELHIRHDQDAEVLMRYWLNTLHLPETAAGSIQRDTRTRHKPTYPGYRGVCLVSGGGSAVQRELLYLGELLFTHISDTAMRV